MSSNNSSYNSVSSNDKVNKVILENHSNNHKTNLLYEFWKKDIWHVDISKITNQDILGIFLQLKKYQEELDSDTTSFLFDSNYQIMITDNKKIIKRKISQFKKDKIAFLKTHADCFIEYHLKIASIFTNKNLKLNNMSELLIPNINIPDTTCDAFNKDNLEKFIGKFLLSIMNPELSENNLNALKNDIGEKLRTNLFKHINELMIWIKNAKKNNKNFVLIDIENILKSFKIQDFLKSKLSQEEYLNYFGLWNNGNFCDDGVELSNDMSLSEYSQKTKYTEPFTSLGLDLGVKFKLAKIIIHELLCDYNVLCVLTSNIHHYDKIDSIWNNSMFIPITYKRTDIREQDDHLIIFMYELLDHYNAHPIIISSDKFSWYNKQDNELDALKNINIKNFKYLYDFDNSIKKLVIGNGNTSDIYVENSQCFLFPLINYPIVSDIEKITKLNIQELNFTNNIMYPNNLLNHLILYSVCETNQHNLIKYDILFNNIEIITSDIKKTFKKIFDFLNSKSKKDIFKITIDSKQTFFAEYQIEKILAHISDYKLLIEIFQVIKMIGIKKYSSDINFIIYLTKLFTDIVEIYDRVQDNLYKIRKLSNSKSSLKKIFLCINITFIYIRKQGYFKKCLF